MKAALRRVVFDTIFEDVWDRDDPYRAHWLYFLDKMTGEHRALPNPEDMALGSELAEEEAWRRRKTEIEGTPGRFVEVPMLAHSEHHEIFAQFAKTLPEEVQALNAESSRMPGVGPGQRVYSIGGFLEEAETIYPNLDVRDQWHGYHRDALPDRAERWYRQHGFTIGRELAEELES